MGSHCLQVPLHIIALVIDTVFEVPILYPLNLGDGQMLDASVAEIEALHSLSGLSPEDGLHILVLIASGRHVNTQIGPIEAAGQDIVMPAEPLLRVAPKWRHKQTRAGSERKSGKVGKERVHEARQAVVLAQRGGIVSVALAIAKVGILIHGEVEVAFSKGAGTDQRLKRAGDALSVRFVPARPRPDLFICTLHQRHLDALRQPFEVGWHVDHQVRDRLEMIVPAFLEPTPELQHVPTALGCAQDGSRAVLLDLL
mmetsp:Transcript_10719/g.33041  ORF Transcript_10719/g.33041 Transcript_10719/m.33041 type:complete len:255 (-) Transcript_10719:682-1446(-)|eukprot:scaffold153783_cov35-Tisochrysis_lutea.AAC.3